MFKSKIIFSLLVVVAVLIPYGESLAVPADPTLHTMTQPDGMTFKARPWGDENIDGLETEDGYSIVFDKAINRWTYAVYGEDGSLVSSSRVVGIDSPPDVPLWIRPSAQNIVRKMLTREKRAMDYQLQSSPMGMSAPQALYLGQDEEAYKIKDATTISIAVLKEETGISEDEIFNGTQVTSEVEITPGRYYLLSDGKTKIWLNQAGSLNGIMGRPKVELKNVELDIIPTTIVANNNFIYKISTPYNCKTHGKLVGDVGVTTIDSCMFRITTEKKTSSLIKLQRLYGTFDFDIMAPIYYGSINGDRTSPIQKIRGVGQHFVGIRVIDTGKHKSARSGTVFIDLILEVITNFGAAKISVGSGQEGDGGYKQEEVIIIGPERIKVKVLSFKESPYQTYAEIDKARNRGDKTADSVKLGVSVEPTRDEEEAMIIEYDDRK